MHVLEQGKVGGSQSVKERLGLRRIRNGIAEVGTERTPIAVGVLPVALVALVHSSQSFCSGTGSMYGATGAGSGGLGAVATRNASRGRVLECTMGSRRPVNFCGLSKRGEAAGTSHGATPLNLFLLSGYSGIIFSLTRF